MANGTYVSYHRISELRVRKQPFYYYIKSGMHEFVLEVNGKSERSRINVCPKREVPVDNQLWHLDDVGDGFVYICSKLDPLGGLVMDIERAKTGRCANIIIYHRKDPERSSRDKTPANQKWKFQSDGTIVSALNGLVLDVKGAKREAGTPLITYPRKEAGLISNQQWYFEPAFTAEKIYHHQYPADGRYPSDVPQHSTPRADIYEYSQATAPGYYPQLPCIQPYPPLSAASAPDPYAQPYPPPASEITVQVYNN